MSFEGRNRVRVLFFHANNHDVGGADFCMFKMAEALDRDSFEPLVVLRLRTRVADFYKKAGIPVRIIDAPRIQKRLGALGTLRILFEFVRSVRYLTRLIQAEHISLVHSNDLLDFHAAMAARLAGVRSVQHVRMIPPPGITRAVLRRLVTLFNDRVLCVSHCVAESTLAGHPKACVLYDWLDPTVTRHECIQPTDLRAELALPADAILVGCVGRIEPWKGQDVLIRAAPKILEAFPNTWFPMVGTTVAGKERCLADFQGLAESLGVAERIHFLGERNDVLPLMRSFDVLVHTSISPDPLPGVVMEGGLAEKVVVGSRAGGVPEEIPERNRDYLYEPGNSDDLATAVINLLHDTDRYSRGTEARRFVMDRFDKRTLVRQLQELYRELL